MNGSLKISIKNACTIAYCVVFVWSIFSSVSLSAQTTQTKSAVSNGGAVSSSTTYVHISTVGQTFVGRASASATTEVGFLGGNSNVEALAKANVTSTTFPDAYELGTADGISISIAIDNVALVQSVTFSKRKLSSTDASFTTETLTADGSSYVAGLSDTDFDGDIGVQYFFEINSLNGATEATATTTIYADAPDGEIAISGLRFGSSIGDYQIVAVPYTLDNRNVLNVFDELAPYDDTRWRLFHYSGGQTNEFDAFSTIDIGKGYWLIVASSTTLNLGAGSAPRVTNAAPFEITLQTGWNQIGNPYNFTIAWDQILAANGDPSGVGNLFQLSGSTLGQSNSLNAFRGGFVENTSGASVVIQIPPDKNSIGGRSNDSDEGIKQPIDSDEWEVQLGLTDGVFTNAMGGIGMRRGASEGQDRFDVSGFPTPFDLAEIRFAKDDIELTKSIVPRAPRRIWDFEITGLADQVELVWDNSYFGENALGLILLDLDANRLVNMKEVNKLSINLNQSRNFKILYGDEEFIQNNALPVSVGLGDIYPNPFNTIVNVPFTLNGGNVLTYKVDLRVFDLGGREIMKLAQKDLQAGFHQVIWKPDLNLPRGVYHVVLEVKNGSKEWKLNKKIIFK